MLPETWQELLDELSSNPKSKDIIDRICKNRNQEDVVEIFLSEESYRGKLLSWIRRTEKKADWQKSTSLSYSYRMQGNEKFKAGNDVASLVLYTKSVVHAPIDNEEMSLALANRSAVLYHKRAYEECLQDISLALGHGYPASLHYKLYLRRGQCLHKLGRCQEAVEALEVAQRHPDLSEKSPLRRDLDTVLAAAIQRLSVGLPPAAVEIPVPVYGESEEFPHASSALELRSTPDKGRHVVTTRDIKMGDVLFVEKPYAFVVLPDQYGVHCHHCCASFVAPVPCKECTQALYCTESCREESWHQYHRWECHGGLDLMHSVGIAHLGLRVVLKTGPLSKLRDAANYGAVYHLLPHLEDMHPQDLMQYVLTAVLLTLYLQLSTDYFNMAVQCDDDLRLVGGLILRHIAQLVCNAHAITKLDVSAPDSDDQRVVSESQVRVATAIYPSASMMNHSCDPNITNSFHNEVLIVRACKDIASGGEVFNCYGPHYRRMNRRLRQEVLQSQYFFTCSCEHCSQLLLQDFQDRFSALLCTSCTGPLIPGDESSHKMVCGDCGHSQEYSSQVEAMFKAHRIYNEACSALEEGNMKDAVEKFESCWALRQKCLYRSHKDLAMCADQVAKCYAMLGQYDKSAQFLVHSLSAVEEQFGAHSVELANELQKLTDILMCELEQCPPNSPVYREKHKVATEYVQRARRILELHYGAWNSGLREILTKECKLQESG